MVMFNRFNQRKAHERLLNELEEVEDVVRDAAAADRHRDAQDAQRDAHIIAAIARVNRNVIAIGKIEIARLNNIDDQLDRIEAAHGQPPPQPIPIIAVVTAIRNRQT